MSLTKIGNERWDFVDAAGSETRLPEAGGDSADQGNACDLICRQNGPWTPSPTFSLGVNQEAFLDERQQVRASGGLAHSEGLRELRDRWGNLVLTPVVLD